MKVRVVGPPIELPDDAAKAAIEQTKDLIEVRVTIDLGEEDGMHRRGDAAFPVRIERADTEG